MSLQVSSAIFVFQASSLGPPALVAAAAVHEGDGHVQLGPVGVRVDQLHVSGGRQVLHQAVL